MSTARASGVEAAVPSVIDWRQLATSAAWTGLVLFVLLALLLAIRRLSGAVAQPIPGPLLILLAAGIAPLSVLLRLWLLPVPLPALARLRLRDWLVLVAPSIALVVLLAAVITPGTNWLSAVAAFLIAGVIERLFWRHLAVSTVGQASRLSSENVREQAGRLPYDSADEESYPPNLLQQIVRTREEAGEAIHAVLRAEFQPGEQLQVLHVAFCPPLDDAPQLEAFVAGAIDADVKVTGSYAFGARLEVQLAQPAHEPASVLVELTGACRAGQDGSAGADPP